MSWRWNWRYLWPRRCPKHKISFASELCPQCNGERVARLEVVDDRDVAHSEALTGQNVQLERAYMDRLVTFNVAAVRRDVRGRRRNDLERARRRDE